jgi:hypothetical protein
MALLKPSLHSDRNSQIHPSDYSMPFYCLAEQNLFFFDVISELELFEIKKKPAQRTAEYVFDSVIEESSKLISRTKGWVANKERLVEVYTAPVGMLLKVDGCGEFFIAPKGETICKRDPSADLTKVDRQVILGPGLVLALALRGIWSLHASAVMHRNKTIVFLGESGQGKSTLAKYLSGCPGWRLVADDILPVRIIAEQVHILPRFPQLKLPRELQPGPGLPERLPLVNLCVLTPTRQDTIPELQLLPPSLAIQALLGHTAGTRMFTSELLGKHLSFCSQVAMRVPVYQLAYPHRREALPGLNDLRGNLC